MDQDAPNVEILVVGGGGAGGAVFGGGGGGGGVVYTVNQNMTAGDYKMVVGGGGQGVQMTSSSMTTPSNPGQDSYISDPNGNVVTMDMGGVSQELKGIGGGGGGLYYNSAGKSGGNGGGGSAIHPAGSGTAEQHFREIHIGMVHNTFLEVKIVIWLTL